MSDGSVSGGTRLGVMDPIHVIFIRAIVSCSRLRYDQTLLTKIGSGALRLFTLRFFELEKPPKFFAPSIQRHVALTFRFIDRSHNPAKSYDSDDWTPGATRRYIFLPLSGFNRPKLRRPFV